MISYRCRVRRSMWGRWKSEGLWQNLELFLTLKRVQRSWEFWQIWWQTTLGVGVIGNLNTMMISPQLLDRVQHNLFMTSRDFFSKQRWRHCQGRMLMRYVVIPWKKSSRMECTDWSGWQVGIVTTRTHRYFWVTVFTLCRDLKWNLVRTVENVSWECLIERQRVITRYWWTRREGMRGCR